MVISRQASEVYFVTVTKIGSVDLDAEQVKMLLSPLGARTGCFVTSTQEYWRITRKNEKCLPKEIPSRFACSLERGEHRHGILKVMLNTERLAEKLMLLKAGRPHPESEIEFLDAQHVYL